MAFTKSNTRIVYLAALTAMATVFLSYGAQAADTCAWIFICKDGDGGCEALCERLVGDGSRNYCKSKQECCCPPSTKTESCRHTLYPCEISDCQARCKGMEYDPRRAYCKKAGKYTDCCCPQNGTMLAG